MNVLAFLIPISVTLGLAGLVAFVWALRSGQYEDPAGDQARALSSDRDDRPGP
ncbi:cbb3-type cytochrome oxidase assembly protein CcoS [Wenxinia saemankumensis]|uniref:Cytochrome oxidase maturation protein, cbb3-type n=1 Tax=Wenxinia saemankumensis TaxID=1447782 RepID=A0A1M6CQX6_9RHOB|nr:cbb3-type cytochrome oxidase assembly protein CcoS [Wenxinia saemankumensis]SHI63283.1 cytochrome oxidase maturation protein, cbb3-type [Wenxinia saemankumensis]